ncbi:cell division protein FtsQ/DivIB [Corynebacterium riegelii]|uniref:cell division protein FtsQ/DivIB n=1 Tax=Corynebacterium riegelii TaxID=156976 RepID=UPI00288B30A6|nr:FtsQ-type POTRA domain-containing protein [Corynebacterium riegelii]
MSTKINFPPPEDEPNDPAEQPEPEVEAPEVEAPEAEEFEAEQPEAEEPEAEPEPAVEQPEAEPAEPEEPEPEPEPVKQPAWPENEKPKIDPVQQRIRRRRAALSIGGCLGIVAVLAAVAPFTPVVPMRGINVHGNHVLTEEYVQQLADIAPDTPMGRVDVRRAAQNIAADPWVETVTVSRDWPSSVDVEVTEHVAVAFIAQDDGTHLIDSNGVDFLVAEPPPQAIELVGAPVEDAEAMAAVVDIAASISERARNEIAAIDVAPLNHVLRTNDGRTIVWGASEDNENKSYALEAVLQMEGREFNITNPQLVTSR